MVCGPSYCTDVNTLEKCDNTAVGDIDIATEMAKIKTQTCTQATEEKCTKIWLDANINVGRDGDGGIIAAYCTDRYLVLQTTMKAGWGLDIMNSISQPPGNSDNTCVTGEISATMNRLETHIFPLEHVYDLWDTDNNTQNADYFENGAQQAGQGDAGTYFDDGGGNSYALPSDSGIGISVAGQSIYPLYSNTVVITLQSCEVDACNEHVGQGGGQPHLHGDPFSNTAGECLYSPENYTNASGAQDLTVHPPVIGFSYDGPLIYGRYLSASAPGFSDGLDNCGGHVHDSYSYHYHAQVIQATTDAANKGINKNANTGTKYPAFVPGVYNCWRGKILDTGPNDDKAASDLFFWSKDQEKDLTAVCDGSENYWVKDGHTLVGVTTPSPPPPSPPPSPPSPPPSTTDDGAVVIETTTDDTSTTTSSASSVVASIAVAAAVAVAAM